ncbi:V-type ATP synthase subunit D [Anaeromyxobacter oryzae]|uniref:ATP synthase subunit D n=1 Tax=Anaeromyxobacter oryzae TaxID=2918170 RepID=A0ABM7WPR5_9BACT|nr:V-type ATP synthase subunit D [Anaeromyxobacter oryzae]BDG01461.1 ATP synthase subunit D [Anaeromyxobacter oryzae]
MPVALSKSSLQQQRDRLRLFERFLPSLELKRQQLTAEYKKAVEELAEAERAAARVGRSLEALLPLLGTSATKLSGLVRVRRVEVVEEDVLGLRLPALGAVEFEVAEYSLIATPAWLDDAVTCIQEAATQRLRVRVYRARVARMQGAVRRVSQRVNLFEKVLIPGAHRDIARIRIFLSDVERSAVVTSKIAKGKRARERAGGQAEGGGR